MPLPLITTPAQGSIHHHETQKTFYWSAGSPPVVPTHWRVKVGGIPGAWNYYAGAKIVAEPAHQVTFSFTTMPPTGKTCYAFVEWSTDGGATFPNQGDIMSFICKP